MFSFWNRPITIFVDGVYIYIYIPTYIHTYLHVYIYIYIRIYYIRMRINTYIYIYTWYIHIYIYIYNIYIYPFKFSFIILAAEKGGARRTFQVATAYPDVSAAQPSKGTWLPRFGAVQYEGAMGFMVNGSFIGHPYFLVHFKCLKST